MEDELGIPPSVRVRQIVEDLDDQGGDLRDLLSSAQIEAGAMVCRYEVFRSICEVEIRRLSRQGRKVHIIDGENGPTFGLSRYGDTGR